MKTAAIVLDSWKLPTFKKLLKKGGYTFKLREGLSSGTVILKVQAEDLKALEKLVRQANGLAAKSRMH